MNGDKQFGEALEKVKGMGAKEQKKAFDSILKRISGDSSDKEIVGTVKEVIFWVAELC